MKVLHISHSDNDGGAARAAYRIHKALLDHGIESRMLVQYSKLDDWTVKGFDTRWDKILAYGKQFLASKLIRFLRSENRVLHSPSIFSSNLVNKINNSDADLIHLHWVQGEMLTIKDISKINKPLVWTLHDMWGFCGAEHVSWDDRFKEGYFTKNRPAHENGIDINRWIWNLKKKYWKIPIQIIAPSHWLASCINESSIMQNWPVNVIPNPLNIKEWKPINKIFAREILDLPAESPIVLFGTMGSNMDHNKGYDLLIEALNYIQKYNFAPKDLILLIFGQSAPQTIPLLPFPVKYVGNIHDNLTLRTLYSAVDLVVVPSRIESFGQTASEAHSCGTPVVAFKTSGLIDIVEHLQSGYLASPFDPIDLAKGICWILNNPNISIISEKARSKAVECFASEVIAKDYSIVYDKCYSSFLGLKNNNFS